MTVINTNSNSLITQAALVKTNRNLANVMAQLSTGNRISSAKDDVAGLAISSRMTAQIRGLDQAVRNANDGISMIQTAEGALVEISNMIQRMRELAVQSANDTYGDKDREYLNLEFQQLKAEINRIAENTQWNGMPVLKHVSPNNGQFEFQVGANSNQKIVAEIPDFTLSSSVVSNQTSTIDSTKLMASQDLVFTGDNWNNAIITFEDSQGNRVQSIQIPANLDSNLAGDYIVAEIQGSLSTLADDYNFVDTGVSSISISPSSSNTNPLPLKVTIDRNGQQVEIIQNITWQDGSVSNNVTAADFDGGLPSTTTTTTTTVTTTGSLNILSLKNILTESAASDSIDSLDEALSRVSSGRASLGAIINRLTHAADNLTNVSTNTTESRSRILDTDYAKASAELAKDQIVQQAAMAMLAQANSQPQAVLKLLQG